MSETNQEIINASMKIIMAAGDGRLLIQTSLDNLRKNDFNLAKQNLKEAHKTIRLAHVEQTRIIQAQTEDAIEAVPLLFTHAQDTLMTINSEYITANQLIELYMTLEKRIQKLEDSHV